MPLLVCFSTLHPDHQLYLGLFCLPRGSSLCAHVLGAYFPSSYYVSFTSLCSWVACLWHFIDGWPLLAMPYWHLLASCVAVILCPGFPFSSQAGKCLFALRSLAFHFSFLIWPTMIWRAFWATSTAATEDATGSHWADKLASPSSILKEGVKCFTWKWSSPRGA